MREIKFRGKRVDNGEWVYGHYIRTEHMGIVRHIIVINWAQVYYNSYKVIPETVGQYIGFNDSKRTEEYPNGQPIYEGDIITYFHEACRGCVEWDNGRFEFDLDTHNITCNALEYFKEEKTNIKVTGNIHDNEEEKDE